MPKISLIRPFCLFVLLLGLTLAAACGHRAPPVATLPPDIPGYLGLKEEFGPLDFSPLLGRRLVLDPGHGGFFRGAVGPGGLTEAEVNLGVALYLRGLLEWAGAEVHLTRSADYDFLSPADSSLSSDLAFRVNFSEELQPDVFLSIHHNSTASADPDINETQTYYPLGQEGASLDLARSIHRHLVLNLGISPAKILPGNFHVLRNATVPSVLGEPAMISNPVIEGRLSQAASHELEAQAYFLGLLDFFAGGSPRWQGAARDTLYVSQGQMKAPISWTFEAGDGPGSPGPDPSTFSLLKDGWAEEFQLSADGRSLTWDPRGRDYHDPILLELSGRNLKGRATAPRSTLILPDTMASRSIVVYRENRSGDNYDLIQWRLFSAGFSDAVATNGLSLQPRLSGVSPTQVGKHLDGLLGTPAPTGNLEIFETPENLSWRLLSVAGIDPQLVTLAPPGGWRNRLFKGDDLTAGLSGSPAVAIDPNDPVWFQARGVLPLVDPNPRDGFSPRTISAHDRYWVGELLVPSLFGAVIVLDPAGGGILTDGSGPLGTRGADLNLEVAQAARYLLEGSGATVHLTRTGEMVPSAQDKVRLAGQVEADLFLTIGRSRIPDRVSIRHHPGSTVGQRWAQAQVQAAALLAPLVPINELVVEESYGYLLRHTACPALEVRLPGLYSAEREMEATTPGWAQAESRALLLAAAAALGQEDGSSKTLNVPHIIGRLPQGTALTRADWSLLDGNFPWTLNPTTTGQAPGDSLSYILGQGESGPGLPNLLPRHTLEIHEGNHWQLWLIDTSAGQLNPMLLLEGP